MLRQRKRYWHSESVGFDKSSGLWNLQIDFLSLRRYSVNKNTVSCLSIILVSLIFFFILLFLPSFFSSILLPVYLTLYRVIQNDCRGLKTCHTQYTWDRSICMFLFNRTTLQVFVTYLTGALYLHPLWFYKYQHDNRVRSKLFVACQRWWFQWRFWFVSSVPGYLREEEEHKPDPWPKPIERNHMGLHLENEVASC